MRQITKWLHDAKTQSFVPEAFILEYFGVENKLLMLSQCKAWGLYVITIRVTPRQLLLGNTAIPQ